MEIHQIPLSAIFASIYTLVQASTATLVLFSLIEYQIFRSLLKRGNEKAAYVRKIAHQDCNVFQTSFLRALLSSEGIFWITTLVFVVATCMQLSLLYIGIKLKMLDYKSWGFGQVVTVTIRAPPLAECLHLQLSMLSSSLNYVRSLLTNTQKA